MIQKLDSGWKVSFGSDGGTTADLPCSVCDAMMRADKIPDLYYGENSSKAEKLAEEVYTFENTFDADEDLFFCEKTYLRFYGIDTLAEIILNGTIIGMTMNMHRTYEFDVGQTLMAGENKLIVRIFSPTAYIRKKQEAKPAWGVETTTEGFPQIRKAHYMFGWDWGPCIPDAGLWRGVELEGVNGGRIGSIYAKQVHRAGSVLLTFDTRIEDIISDKLQLDIKILPPEGKEALISIPADKRVLTPECVIYTPMLWNVRGYGAQNLYKVTAQLSDGGKVIDEKEFEIGLRKIELCRSKDEYGEEFCFRVNGIKIFAMGANYIPEDNILSRRSPERTEKLLKSFAAANYNMVRVWGGGFYPDDVFYNTCDKLGLLVWQDFAFACAVYNADGDFCSDIKQEFIDNVKRIRNHPSLAMWCGNNEIESAIQYWGIPVTDEQRDGYLRIFERLIPEVLKHYDPNTVYWPSSPSSGGGFSSSGDPDKGDSHYWAVWHSFKPYTEFRNYYFRFCSEFGMESIPNIKTVRAFAGDGPVNLCSPVMEAHQKCEAGNEKLLYYLANSVHYPYSFEGLVYATQLVQADGVRSCVEHLRRSRGRCMGSLYWQANDSNPCISWSSVDYFGRWKALHYYAKRFYAPVLCSVDSKDLNNIVINVSSEKLEEISGTVRWRVRTADTEVIAEGSADVKVPPLSAVNVLTLTPKLTKLTPKMYRDHYIEYAFVQNGAAVSGGTLLLTLPKRFGFRDPEITVHVEKMGDKYRFEVNSKKYAKGVYLDYDEFDVVFSDNWFDLNGKIHTLIANIKDFPPNVTPQILEQKIKVMSYYDITK